MINLLHMRTRGPMARRLPTIQYLIARDSRFDPWRVHFGPLFRGPCYCFVPFQASINILSLTFTDGIVFGWRQDGNPKLFSNLYSCLNIGLIFGMLVLLNPEICYSRELGFTIASASGHHSSNLSNGSSILC